MDSVWFLYPGTCIFFMWRLVERCVSTRKIPKEKWKTISHFFLVHTFQVYLPCFVLYDYGVCFLKLYCKINFCRTTLKYSFFFFWVMFIFQFFKVKEDIMIVDGGWWRWWRLRLRVLKVPFAFLALQVFWWWISIEFEGKRYGHKDTWIHINSWYHEQIQWI